MKNQQPPSNYIENRDFIFIDALDAPLTLIKLIKGKYEGVVYHYGKVSLDKDLPQPRLKFDYTIIDDNSLDLNDDEEFFMLLGDILVYIMLNNIGEVDAPARTNDIEEFNPE